MHHHWECAPSTGQFIQIDFLPTGSEERGILGVGSIVNDTSVNAKL